MLVAAKSAEAINRALSVLRWQNRLAGLLAGAFVTFFTTILAGVPPQFTPHIAALGGMLGLVLTNLFWHRHLGRLASSFLRLDDEYLEVRGFANGGLIRARFRLSELAAVELGRSGVFGIGSLPIVRSFDRAALVVRDQSGEGIALEMAGVIFDSQELSQFCAHVARTVQNGSSANGAS